VRIEPVTARHREALAAFAAGISDRDRRFADRSLLSQVAVASWTQAVPERRLVAVEDDGKVSGLATVSRGHGWSEHTAVLRVIVATGQRGRGVGRALADAAVGLARDLGISKVTVETMATNEGGQAMFRALGFDAEAVLRGPVIAADGARQDVVLLSRGLDA
jgi:ribosomal protein S18 acetylase RimI-like enzyme